MKKQIVIALILSSTMLLAQNVSTSISQLNQLRLGYSFSVINSNLKVTLTEEYEGGLKGDYFLVPLKSVYCDLIYSESPGFDGFMYKWYCIDNSNCVKFSKNFQKNWGFLDLGMNFENAKKVMRLLDKIWEEYND